MARIERVELRMVDLVPKVKRTDAIQSFVSQETPIVTITDADGATGTGYSYTIGTGGSSVMRLLADHLAPRLIGRDADRIEAIWHELEFATHATTIGAITAIALAAIDTALWDLRARKQGLPLWKLAGGAKDRCPLYTTEGGWLHIETEALVADALAAQEKGFRGSKVKIGRPHVSEDLARLSAVRAAVGDGYEIMTDCNQGFTVDEAIRRAGRLGGLDLAWIEEPIAADDIEGHVRLAASTATPIAVGEVALLDPALPRVHGAGACSIVQVDVGADRRHHPVAQGGARRRGLRHPGLPALPDGAPRQPRLRGAERPLRRVHPPARPGHRRADADRGRPRAARRRRRVSASTGTGTRSAP